MKLLRLLDTTTARQTEFDTGGEYPLWVLWPEGQDRVSDAVATERHRSTYWKTAVIASRLLSVEEPTVFVDVGANFGAVSVPLAKMRPACTVWAFEAAERTFQHLSANIFLNALPNIHAERLGLARAPGLLPLYLTDPSDYGSPTLAAQTTAPTIGVVRVMPLDHHAVGDGRIHLMKIHVPDYTAAILAGARETILKWQMPLLLEIPDPKLRGLSAERPRLESFEAVSELAYDITELFPEHFLACTHKRMRKTLRRSRE